jgi:hypothetical protein
VEEILGVSLLSWWFKERDERCTYISLYRWLTMKKK